MRALSWILVFFVVAAGPGPTVAQRGGKKGETQAPAVFEGGLDAARKEAKERNVPILIHAVLDEEGHDDGDADENVHYRETIIPDEKLRLVCENVLVLVGNNGKHERKKLVEDVDGTPVEREVCEFFYTSTCTEHQKAFDDVYREFQGEDGALHLPQTIVLLPDGKVHTQINDRHMPPIGDVIDAVKRAKAAAGPGLTKKGLVEVRTLCEQARRDMKSRAWADAFGHWSEVLARTTKGPYGEEAQRELAVAEQGLQENFEAAKALLVPGTAAEGYKLLLAMLDRVGDHSIAREISLTLKKAARQKDIKEEIAAFELELEAEELWQEAAAYKAEGDARKHERTIRKLLRSKYAETPAGQRAREEYGRWAEEEAEKEAKK